MLWRITENPNLPLCHLSGVGDWQEDCLSQLRELSRLEQMKNEFYPYEVLTHLTALWHYAEDVTLEQLAQSANVSKAECLRCFHQTMDTTPYKYLMDSACPRRRSWEHPWKPA